MPPVRAGKVLTRDGGWMLDAVGSTLVLVLGGQPSGALGNTAPPLIMDESCGLSGPPTGALPL